MLILPNIQGFIDQWTIWDKAEYQRREPLEEDFFRNQKIFMQGIQAIQDLNDQMHEQLKIEIIISINDYIQDFIHGVLQMDPPPPKKERFLTEIFEVTLKNGSEEE